MNKTYYNAEELAEINGVSKRIVGEVATKFAEIVTCFAAKIGNKRRYNDDEKYVVKFVFDNEAELTREGAIKKALRLFYGIDCKRDYERL